MKTLSAQHEKEVADLEAQYAKLSALCDERGDEIVDLKSARAQLEQSLLRSEDDTAWAQMLLKGVHQAAAAVGAAVAQLGEHNTSRTLSFSPFYSSCIAIRRSRTLATSCARRRR